MIIKGNGFEMIKRSSRVSRESRG